MVYQELLEALEAREPRTPRETIEALRDIIYTTLKEGGEVRIKGLFHLSTKIRKGRSVRSFGRGEFQVPDLRLVRVKISPLLKAAVKNV